MEKSWHIFCYYMTTNVGQIIGLLLNMNMLLNLPHAICSYVIIRDLQNGDYNKPIPAQYTENLNHGVSASLPLSETPKTLQWVNTQMLLCRKCNNNQSAKIKQLASFIPRDDVRIL